MTCESRVNRSDESGGHFVPCGQPMVATVYGPDEYRLPVCERHGYQFRCLIESGRLRGAQVVTAAVEVAA